MYTRRRLLVATAASIVPYGIYAVLRDVGGDRTAPSPPTNAMSTSATSTTTSPGATVPTTEASASPTAPTADTSRPTDVPMLFDHDVSPGSTGEKVRSVQERLRSLNFDPGPADGVFGPSTERAVWAFEKLILGVRAAEVTGVMTPDMWLKMNAPISVRPRRANRGTHVEVLLPDQVAVVYRDNQPLLITHVSSGTGEEWCSVVVVDEEDGSTSEEGICGVSVTPGGVFHFERRIEGWRNSKLGRLYNPVYFNYGIAIHGASNVPKRPASRGCVRIPMHIAEYFPSLVADGDLTYVFDGIQQPETYGAQLPVFDYPDPDYSTTTTTARSSAANAVTG